MEDICLMFPYQTGSVDNPVSFQMGTEVFPLGLLFLVYAVTLSFATLQAMNDSTTTG
jgi:hypothetical protein